nr:zinc finger, CCHC-type [Tanacetum cinerariifolium]
MHVLLSSMSVVYVLTTSIPEDGEDATVEQLRKRAKWDNGRVLKGASWHEARRPRYEINQGVDSRGLILNGMLIFYLIFTKMLNLSKNYEIPWRYNDNKGKRKHQDTKADPNKNSKVTCWKCGKPGHLKRDCKGKKVGNKANGSSTNGSVNDSSYLLKGAIVHVCKDRCWFKTYESLNDGSILHMGNESTALVHGRHVHYKRMQDMSKDRLIPAFDMNTKKCKTCMLTKITKKLFQNVKVKAEVLELIDSDLCDLHATSSLGNKKVPDKRNMITPYELWTKREPNLNYLSVWGCRAVVRLTDPKLKTLGEKGIECIFVGYAEHSKAFRFYVIEPTESVSINSIIESSDVIFDENRFSSVLGSSQRSLINETKDIGGSGVLEEVTEEVVTQQPEPDLRKGKRNRTRKNFGSKFQLYLIKGTRDEVSDQHSYCFNVEDDPKTFNEAMKSQDVALWKEATT